jgi:hypothetical protein
VTDSKKDRGIINKKVNSFQEELNSRFREVYKRKTIETATDKRKTPAKTTYPETLTARKRDPELPSRHKVSETDSLNPERIKVTLIGIIGRPGGKNTRWSVIDENQEPWSILLPNGTNHYKGETIAISSPERSKKGIRIQENQT